ncbi:hypothetical protein O3G_MSEX012720 [Manduca sexta]|nr:hypothetical protein O3G_MSEX012720 [Manduca sexta]
MSATVKPKMDRNLYKKTAELIYLINEIYNNDEDISKEVGNYVNTHNNREMALKQVMKLIQKNYDASKVYKERPKVRMHFISNPEVLEQFKSVLEEKESSSYEDESVASRKLKEILRSLRRQAVFRIDDPESQEKTVPEEQRNAEAIQKSAEDNEKAYPLKKSNVHNSRKKEESKENIENNAWDVITKKYDWDKDNWDAKDKKDWGGKGGNISDEKKSKKDVWGKDKDMWDDKKDKKKEDKWDDWGQKDKKDKNKGLKKKNIYKLDEWGQKEKNDARDDVGKDKKKDNWDDWGEKNDKKDSTWDDVGKHKRKDNWDDLGQKNDKKDKWDTGKDKKKDSWDNWGQQQKKETSNWSVKLKKKVDIKWEQPKNKRKGSDTKDKKNDWDTKWQKKDNWDNWEATTRQKRKTTKRKSESFKKINEWEHYIPKVQSKPKRHEYDRNIPAGAFGRTSIPFVGKKGIYEDK